MYLWSTLRSAFRQSEMGGREENLGVRFLLLPTVWVEREHSCFEFSLPFSVCSIFKAAAEALGSSVLPNWYVTSLLQITCEAQPGKPGGSWEAGEQASSQNFYVSKIHQLPVRHLYEDFSFFKSYLSMESQEGKYGAHAEVWNWLPGAGMLEGGAETLVKRLRLSAVSWTSSVEQTHAVGGKKCVNSLDCDHHQTACNTIIQYQRIPLFITNR